MTTTSTVSRNPVTWAAAIAGVLSAAAAVGLINADQEASVNGVVQALVGAAAFLLPLISSFVARGKVTPLVRPRDDAGNALHGPIEPGTVTERRLP